MLGTCVYAGSLALVLLPLAVRLVRFFPRGSKRCACAGVHPGMEIKYGMELNIGTGMHARLRRSQRETDSSCEDAGFSCLALRNNPHAGILGVKPISALVARPSSVTSRLSCTTADPKGDCWEGSVTPPIETKEICFWRAHDEW